MNTTINVVLPMFLIIALGAIAQYVRFLGEESTKIINRFVYYFPLPILLFGVMAETPFNKIMNFPFIGAFFIGMILTFLLSFILFKWINPANLAITSMRSFGAAFPNAAYMGIPLLFTLFGTQGALPAVLATILTFILMAILIFLLEISLHQQ